MSNKKWLVVLAVAVIGTAVVTGNLPLAGLLPFLFLLVCPVAMLFMMKGMGGLGGAAHGHHAHGIARPTDVERDRATPAGPAPRMPEPDPKVDPSVDSEYRQ